MLRSLYPNHPQFQAKLCKLKIYKRNSQISARQKQLHQRRKERATNHYPDKRDNDNVYNQMKVVLHGVMKSHRKKLLLKDQLTREQNLRIAKVVEVVEVV